MKLTKQIVIWPFILIAFVIWLYCFRDFISGKLSLSSDALAYFEHFKFYIDQISRGVYPLWDPTRDGGVPIEFFLRRIGAPNPFFLLIILLEKCGLSFLLAYLTFLTGYFLLGTIGFYVIAKQLFKDPLYAFLSFLLLLFSSLGTRIFDSYIILTFTPLMWFFYFILKFSEALMGEENSAVSRAYFTGSIFTLMILLNTYLPFYFLTIAVTFLILVFIICKENSFSVTRNFLRFSGKNKFFVSVCLGILLLSLLPGWMFFQELKHGEIVLPLRQPSTLTQSALEVDPVWVKKWGIEEDLAYSSAFWSDLKKFKFAVFYLPVVGCILFCLGIFLKFNRKLVLLFSWMLFLFLISAQQLPVYQFLKSHIGFFKYFRNLHFFLWLALLPIFILYIVEQLRVFKERFVNKKDKQKSYLIYLIILHVFFAIYAMTQTQALVSTYISIALCFIFLYLWLTEHWKNYVGLMGLVILAVVVEAFQVFSYLPQNSGVVKTGSYRYEKPYLHLTLPASEEWIVNQMPDQDIVSKMLNNPGIYLGLKWFNFLDQVIDRNSLALLNYVDKKFLLYDHVEPLKLDQIDLNALLRTIVSGKNTAFVTAEKRDQKKLAALMKVGNRLSEMELDKVTVVTDQSTEIKILKFDVNKIKLKTNLSRMKFLVYNDGYDKKWCGLIDGKELEVWRSNLTFKGVWIPAGEHVVEFRYGSFSRYFLNYALVGLFLVSLIYVIVQMVRIRLK